MPNVLPIIQLLAPLLLSARGSGQQTDPTALFNQLFQGQMGQMQDAFAPILALTQLAAARRGSALSGEISGSLASTGGASSGVGRAALALGNSAASGTRASSEAALRQQMIALASQNAMSLLGPQLGYSESQRSPGENVLDFLARGFSGGQIPDLIQAMFASKPGTSGQLPGGGGLQNTPDLLKKFGFFNPGVTGTPGFGLGAMNEKQRRL